LTRIICPALIQLFMNDEDDISCINIFVDWEYSDCNKVLVCQNLRSGSGNSGCKRSGAYGLGGILMKKILIPVDGSEYSSRAIEKGKEIAAAFNSEVVIFHVIPFHITTARRIHIDAHDTEDEYRAASEALLKKAKGQFGSQAGKVKIASVEGDAAKAIVDYAEENGCDLIIMGSHGLGAVINRFLTGSVTTKVLHNTKITVMVVQ